MAKEYDPNILPKCKDCGKVMSLSDAIEDPFISSGKAAPCRMCGGVMVVTNLKTGETSE